MADYAVREFTMSFADLIGLCDSVHSSITRDAAEMTGYGVTPVLTSDFKTKIDEFLSYPTDASFLTDAVSATESKNALANDLRILVRSIGTRAKIVFGSNNGKYDKFVLKDLSRANDNNLLVFCERVSIEAAKFLPELTSAGLTQSMIDDLIDKANNFRTAVISQDDAVKLRDENSNLRIKKANELYRLLNKYSTIGKNIWYEVNEALYNDYVIYDYSGGSSSGGGTGGGGGPVPAAPTNLGLDTMTMNFYWDQVENATSYQLETSVAGVEWVEIYSGSDSSIYYFPPVAGLMQYRVKARNSNGYGPSSGVMMYNYPGELAAPDNLSITVTNVVSGAITMTWSEVEGATFYKLYGCSVATGAPALPLIDFSYAGEFNVATFSGVGGTGNRRYYYVKAGNSERVSVASEVVFVDL